MKTYHFPYRRIGIALVVFAIAAAMPGTAFAAGDGLAGWVGDWKRGDDHIHLTRKGRTIYGTGDAYYPSRDHLPYPNLGEFEGRGIPKGGRLTIQHQGEDGTIYCIVIMQRTGDKLTVLNHDSRCGGRNVTFKGVYTRQKHSGKP